MDIEVNADPIARPAWMSAEDWLFYGKPRDKGEDDDGPHWTQEVDEYLGILPSDDEEEDDATTATPAWLDVKPIRIPSKHSRTQRYSVTDKQSRRDNASHAPGRSDYDREGNREVRQPKIAAARSADHDQELDGQHREMVDKHHPGINGWWLEKVLDAIRCRILQYQPLSRQDVELLERLRLSTADVLKYGLADWEVELLLAKQDPEKPAVNRERNPFRAGRRRVVGIPAAPRVPFGYTPRNGKMDRHEYRERARYTGYRSGGKVRVIR